MRPAIFAAFAGACGLASIGGAPATAADLDDDYVTRETIIERRPVHERIVVRRYVEPRYDFDDDYYADYYGDPRIGIVAPYWGGRGWGHHRGWHHRRW